MMQLAMATKPELITSEPALVATTSWSVKRFPPTFVSVCPLRFNMPENGGVVGNKLELFKPTSPKSADRRVSPARDSAKPLTAALVELLVMAPCPPKPLPITITGLPVAVPPTPAKSRVAPLFTYIGELIEPSVGILAGVEKLGSNSFHTPLFTLMGPVKALLKVP